MASYEEKSQWRVPLTSSEFLQDVAGPQFPTAEALEIAYPAVDYPGARALVGTVTYTSNGTAWLTHADEHDAMGWVGGIAITEKTVIATVTTQAEFVAALNLAKRYNAAAIDDTLGGGVLAEIVVNVDGVAFSGISLVGVNLPHVAISGLPILPVVVTGVQSSSGSAGDYTVILQCTSLPAGISAGNWLSSEPSSEPWLGVSGGTRPELLLGARQIQSVDYANNRITVKVYTLATVAAPAGAVAGNFYVFRTRLNFASLKNCNIGSFRRVAIEQMIAWGSTLCYGNAITEGVTGFSVAAGLAYAGANTTILADQITCGTDGSQPNILWASYGGEIHCDSVAIAPGSIPGSGGAQTIAIQLQEHSHISAWWLHCQGFDVAVNATTHSSATVETSYFYNCVLGTYATDMSFIGGAVTSTFTNCTTNSTPAVGTNDATTLSRIS